MPEKCVATCKDGSECNAYPVEGSDKCRMHAGKNGDSHEGNDWAAKHGAWRDSFVQDHLRDDEIERVKQGESLLGKPETAQDVGKSAAMLALEQYRRTGDDRFLRRFESICDTFGLAPADEMDLNVDGDVDVTTGVTAEFVAFTENDGDGE